MEIKKAFTLAEVLVTLGIIGIVASLTIPNLMQKRTNIEVESKLKKIYSVMNQAILLSENDNGPKEYWQDCGYDEGNLTNSGDCRRYYETYILPYLSDVKAVDYKSAYGYNIIIYFNDGTLLIGKNDNKRVDYFFYPNGKNFIAEGFIGTNPDGSFNRVRKDLGITFFAFSFAPSSDDENSKWHYKKGFEPFKHNLDQLTPETLKRGGWACSKNGTNRAYCTALIQLNGWKIPKDYPLTVK